MAEQSKPIQKNIKPDAPKKVAKEQLKQWDEKAQQDERRRRWVLGLGPR